MKNTAVLLILILFCTIRVKGQWMPVFSGTNLNLVQVVFPDSMTGYILGQNITGNKLLKSVDGGNSWNVILNGHTMSCFDFISADTGVVVANDSVFKTFDGGLSWTSFYSHPLAYPKLFHMNSADDWFYIRSQSSAYTNDGGTTWYPSSSGVMPIVPTDYQFVNDTTVIGVGWYTTKSFISNDKGHSWVDLSYFLPTGSGAIWSVCFTNPVTGFATGNNRILKSIDNGLNWNNVDSTFNISCIRHIDENHLYGVGYGGSITKTADAGNTWSPEFSGTNHRLNKIVFTNSHTAIVIGDTGTILMHTNISTGMEQVFSDEDFVLVFPTPVSENLTIQFKNKIQFAEINVLNVLGESVLKENISGISNTILNVADLPGGLFFLKVSYDKQFFITKILKQ